MAILAMLASKIAITHYLDLKLITHSVCIKGMRLLVYLKSILDKIMKTTFYMLHFRYFLFLNRCKMVKDENFWKNNIWSM